MHHNHQHLHHHGINLDPRSTLLPEIVPRNQPPFLLVPDSPTLVKREPLPTTNEGVATQSCAAGDNSNRCEKPASSSSTTTLPIVLGAVIPIVCAIAVLVFLHRRNLKKLRKEDANDKHKSLDFGLDLPSNRGNPMREAEKGTQNSHMKGVSLDIGPSPYMLPPSMRGSRDSIHSLTRTIMGDDDKYRHASNLFPADNLSIGSHQRGFPDETASLAGSTRRGALGEDMNQGLLGGAQKMSQSSPPLYSPPSDHGGQSPATHGQVHDTGFQLDLPRSPSPVFVPGLTKINELPSTVKSGSEGADTTRAPASGPLPEHRLDFPLRDSSTLPALVEPNATPMHNAPIPTPRISLPSSDAASDYGDNRASHSVVPAVNVQNAESNPSHEESRDHTAMPKVPEEPPQSQNPKLDPRRDTRRLTVMGLRPLPPDDPTDNPEQRANRIRSFYKEYFDESKAGARETHYQDYGDDYYAQEDYAYGPVTGEYFDAVPAPYAEPVNRRAMTPPPRAPPRFQGGPRHMATGSVGGFSGRFQPTGPRAFSSASGHLPGPRAPRKPAPPPTPLNILPSPHMLKDDAIMMAADYAPGKTFRDQQEGRPETPLGGVRPFSPMIRAHTPLASAFDELSVIPSAHQLRKSGTYDNLDFAPPPRFKNSDTASDSGSIRSNRTGISATHLHNIRTGAYRVSRLPPEAVGTRDDLMSNLRPTWDMRQ